MPKYAKLPPQHATKPAVLSPQRPVHHSTTLLVESLERPREAVRRHQLPQYPFPLPRFPPQVSEPEKIEGRRQWRMPPDTRRPVMSTIHLP